jgi:ubiquinone/menaquinone biosynthesis C-methylase UbiE
MTDTIPTVPEILDHYDQGSERGRLSESRGQLERARTQELLTRHLPPPPAVIVDVGGGPGVYARWLAAQGYEVHLIDPVPLHVEQAQRDALAANGRPLASASTGDARRLHVAAARADAVLLLGPLYHLTDRADRLRALREATRVVRPGGVIFAVGISRFASLFDGLSAGFLDDAEFVRIVDRDLRDGQHRNPGDHPDYFTTAFFHHPNELQEEVREAGLSIVETVAIEGPGWWMPREFETWWDDPARRDRLLAAVRAVEREPSVLGLGPHLMVVARTDRDSSGASPSTPEPSQRGRP